MDMRSKDILKEAIKAYDGTVVLVSHDREFLDGLVSKVYEFHDGRVKEYIGGIYDFLERKKVNSMREIEARKTEEKVQQVKNTESKVSYQEKRDYDKKLRKLSNDISKVESQIEESEALLEQMNAQLAEPEKFGIDLSNGEFYEKYEAAKRENTRLMVEWERLSEELEYAKNQ
jgi:ATP-binding cassette subfamily F protein 3